MPSRRTRRLRSYMPVAAVRSGSPEAQGEDATGSGSARSSGCIRRRVAPRASSPEEAETRSRQGAMGTETCALGAVKPPRATAPLAFTRPPLL